MKIKSLFVHPILKSFVPLLIGGTYHLFKELLTNSALIESSPNLADLEQKLNDGEAQGYKMKSEEMPFNLLSMLNHVSFGIYSSFFVFMLVMLLIDALSKTIELGVKEFWREAKSSRVSLDEESSTSSVKKRRVVYQISENQMMKILSYALIFTSLQFSGLCQSFIQSHALNIYQGSVIAIENSQDPEKLSPLIVMNNDQENSFGMPRVLSEDEEGIQDNELVTPVSSPHVTLSDKISLSMGNVLGSLSLDVRDMVLSKDRKIAYVTLASSGALKVVDISNLKSPFVLGSLHLEVSNENYRIKNLLLSSDGKTLYASNSRDLEIINVTDSSSPKLISLTKSEVFSKKIYGTYRNSLVIQERTKTLFIGGIGLQVYDVSDPKKPALMKALKNDWKHTMVPTRNEICLSRDGEVLFVANGTLDIYNISDPKNMKLLSQFKMESSPRSLLLSEDERTVFLLGTSAGSYIQLEEVDISDYSSISIRKSWNLGYRSFSTLYFLAVSPSKSKFFISADFGFDTKNFLVFDIAKQTTIRDENSLIEYPEALNFSPDGRILLAASKDHFKAIEFFLDYPNSQIFSKLRMNVKSNIPVRRKCANMQISDDEKYLFILHEEEETESNFVSIFEIWDMRNTSEPRLSSFYNCSKFIKQMHLTKNHEVAYMIGEKSLQVLVDLLNSSSVNLKKEFTPLDQKDIFSHFTTSVDEKTGFLLTSKEGSPYLSFLDLTQALPSIIGASIKLDTEFKEPNSRLLVKDNETLIIILQGGFLIYDVSNIDSPTQIASLPFGQSEPDPEWFSPLLSSDKKTLYIETSTVSGFQKLRVYDVSISKSPHLIAENELSKRSRISNEPRFSLSPLDLKTGFLSQQNFVLKLNLTNPKDIQISGIIPFSNTRDAQARNFLVSPDGQTIYANYYDIIRIINIYPKETLFLKQEKFLLGEKYSGQLALLNLTGTSDYSPLNPKSFKIIKLSLLDMKIAPNKAPLEMTTSLLPSWITFDRESHSLTVEAKRQQDLGRYTFVSTFSLKIPKDIFDKLGTTEKPLSSRNLWAWLVSLGYVDNERFLGANFFSGEDFFLPEEFNYHIIEILDILRKFSFETCTGFEVESSLKLKEINSTIAISTLSPNSIKVEVDLEPNNGSETKFVSKSYGSLLPVFKNNNKTKISLEGTLKEVNLALNSIVVNFENGTSCDARIVLNDGFNPQVLWELKNISRYFKANKSPYVNSLAAKTVQEQIDSADIQTGTYFTFPFSEDTFGDEFAEHLDYEIVMANNKTAFPNWLSLSGLTLKGTPPEEIMGRDIDLILISKNEFKQYEVPFKLHIKISLFFWLKLLMRYCPYILTLIAIFVNANKILNILRKGLYKHSKEFYIGVDEEITTNAIFPISFVEEENKQSQLILKCFRLRQGFAIADFIDSEKQILDKEKITLAIKETIQNMPMDKRKQITLYPSSTIDQIIINKFVWMQLDSRDEIQTKQLFKELEPNCLEIVERDASLGFIVNQNKFNQVLKRVQMSSTERNSTLEESLISHDSIIPGVNISLLKDAILAVAFEKHSVDISPLSVDIGIKQKVPSNIIWRFLKLDLKEIHLNEKNRLDYGINYRISNDKLVFNGIAQAYFKDKTVVVQVKNLHQKILKEVWIHGVSNGFQKDGSFMRTDEREARGQGYEIF